jgi:hypothetical protein
MEPLITQIHADKNLRISGDQCNQRFKFFSLLFYADTPSAARKENGTADLADSRR